jgi:hypothetical protein
VTATKHTIRLYRRNLPGVKSTTEVYLDPKDNARLLDVLREVVEAHQPGQRIKLDDWRIEVEQQAWPRHVVAKVQVSASGSVEVKR